MPPEIAAIFNALGNMPFLAFALALWWSERSARVESERRERALLRELADCKPEV